jgi:PAS domain S-box-containing protein
MTLRTKTLALVGLTLTGMQGILYYAAQTVALQDYRRLEAAHVRQNVARAEHALAHELDGLAGTAREWAARGDAASGSAGLGLTDGDSDRRTEALLHVGANFVAYVQSNGEVASGCAVEFETCRGADLPLLFDHAWSPDHPLLRRALEPNGVQGVLMLSEGPLLLAGQPIATSVPTDATPGALFLGRLLDAAALEHMAHVADLQLTLNRPTDEDAPVELLMAGAGTASPVAVRELDDRSVRGYTLLCDLHGQPALVLGVCLPRDIYNEGRRSVRTLVLAVVGTGAVFGALLLLLVEWLVVGPTGRLSREVHAIARRGDPTARVSAGGGDELAQLGGAINHMLTALEQSQHDLRVSADRFQALFENAGDAIFWADPETGLLLNCNRAAEALVQRPRSELIGQPQTCLHPAAQAAHYAELFRQHVAHGEALTDDVEVVTSDGSVRLVRLSACITNAGNQRIAQGVFYDQTAQRQSAERLREANTMLSEALDRERHVALQLEATMQQLEAAMRDTQAANQAKSDFLANMSHEIRTPLTAINGFADVLAEELGDETLWLPAAESSARAALVQHVSTIRTNGQHLLALINDILDLSKIEAGKLEVERTACSPFELIAAVESAMSARARGKGLEFRLVYATAIPERIRTDPMRLRQILFNLVGNAIKFTERGTIELSVDYVVHLQRPVLRFAVRDSGIGMTAEQLARVFQPFVQGDASLTRRFGGTGLGLVISKRLAEALGGDVTVESTPGQGSVFHLRIAAGPADGARLVSRPEDATAAAPTTRAVATSALHLTGRVLLAEDGPDNQRLIAFILRKVGLEVTIADNGQAAVEMALLALEAGRSFDVILMDIQMPVLNGYEATRRLRARGYRGPIIALTAHAMTSARTRCLASGCNDFCSKPIDRRVLLDTIARHLQKEGQPT